MLTIRRMEKDDLEAVFHLEQRCFSEPWSLRLLTEALDNAYDWFWAAEEDGRICGYANLRILAGESEIQRIAVDPDLRRRGIARKLMEAMEETAGQQGASDISLEVRAGNTAAQNLYISFGFAAEAVRRGYYRNPAEDAVIMWRRGT